jgi:hypothetical protein
MKTKELQEKNIRIKKRYRNIFSNLNKKLTIAYEIIDELQTERDRKEEIRRRDEDYSLDDYF